MMLAHAKPYSTIYHNMITTIAMATYTFLTFAFAIINLVKYKNIKALFMWF